MSLLRSGKQIVLAIATMPKPVLAAVNGAAAGAGCNLALACAPRIASDRAIFVQSFAKLGLFPDFGATYFLPRLLGSARAADLLYTGETISAADAARLGLVSRVVPHDTLAEEAAALAKSLAAAPPLVVRGIKQALFTDHRDGITAERTLGELFAQAGSRHAVANDDERFAHRNPKPCSSVHSSAAPTGV